LAHHIIHIEDKQAEKLKKFSNVCWWLH